MKGYTSMTIGHKGQVRCKGCEQWIHWTQATLINDNYYCHMCIKSDAPLETLDTKADNGE